MIVLAELKVVAVAFGESLMLRVMALLLLVGHGGGVKEGQGAPSQASKQPPYQIPQSLT